MKKRNIYFLLFIYILNDFPRIENIFIIFPPRNENFFGTISSRTKNIFVNFPRIENIFKHFLPLLKACLNIFLHHFTPPFYSTIFELFSSSIEY